MFHYMCSRQLALQSWVPVTAEFNPLSLLAAVWDAQHGRGFLYRLQVGLMRARQLQLDQNCVWLTRW